MCRIGDIMKLSKKDKMELRKSVEVLLNASPDNKKIQLLYFAEKLGGLYVVILLLRIKNSNK